MRGNDSNIVLHSLYEPAFNRSVGSNYRYLDFWGGRSRGGSFAAIIYAMSRLLAPEYCRIAFIRRNYNDLRHTLFQEFQDALDQQFSPVAADFKISTNVMTATYKPNGNMIISKGAVGSETRTARLKSLAGINVAIIEEAVELTELEFDQLDISLRLKNSDITIVRVFNPPASNHWIWRDYNFVSAEAIFKKFDLPTEYLDKFRTAEPKPGSRVYSFRSDYLDNAANLDDSFLKGVVPRTRERHLESYIINLVGLISVQAFNAVYSWDETSDAEFNNFKFEAEALGIDFGYGEAYTAITHVKMNKTEQRVMIKLLYYQAFSLSRDICKMISDANLLSLICVADSGNGGNYRIAEFRRGIVMEDGSTIELNMVPAMKGPGSILAGIDVVNSYSVEYVSNKFIKEELDNYAYSNLATKELVGVCHALDSARYAIKYLHTNT